MATFTFNNKDNAKVKNVHMSCVILVRFAFRALF
jgi:hypothetical protein